MAELELISRTAEGTRMSRVLGRDMRRGGVARARARARLLTRRRFKGGSSHNEMYERDAREEHMR